MNIEIDRKADAGYIKLMILSMGKNEPESLIDIFLNFGNNKVREA